MLTSFLTNAQFGTVGLICAVMIIVPFPFGGTVPTLKRSVCVPFAFVMICAGVIELLTY